MADQTNEYERRRKMAELSQRVEQSASELSTSGSYGGTSGTVRQPIVGPRKPVTTVTSSQSASQPAPRQQFTVNPQWGSTNIPEVTDIMTDGRGGSIVSARSGIAGAWDSLRSRIGDFSGRHASWFRR